MVTIPKTSLFEGDVLKNPGVGYGLKVLDPATRQFC
jgi:hypothetical protein